MSSYSFQAIPDRPNASRTTFSFSVYLAFCKDFFLRSKLTLKATIIPAQIRNLRRVEFKRPKIKQFIIKKTENM